MMRVVVPLAANLYFESSDYPYPKPLIEIGGLPIIQRVVNSLKTLPDPKRFIFVISRQDDRRFYLQDTLKLVTDGQCEVVVLDGPSKGAACSVLMAIEHLQGSSPVVVANGDQIFHIPLRPIVTEFQKKKLEAGVISFDSVHPRWSYVRLGPSGQVVEAAEKRPLSRHAIAGFYYFSSGDTFLRAIQQSIRKGVELNGAFYIAPVLNEYVLEDRKVGHHAIDKSKFQSFYSIQKIEEAQRGPLGSLAVAEAM